MSLTIESVSKAFPGVQALDHVSLELRPGEIHALMGENGAGKSTLIKIITGLYPADSGRMLIDGKEVAFQSSRDAIAAGISAVHQERNLIPRFSVGENILLERLPARRGLLDRSAIHREARRYLDLLDGSIDTRAEVRTLSVAQMQIVEIAKALSLEAKYLLMDEPTASITEHEANTLFGLLKRLRDNGAAIVFVSHKLEEIFAIADRVTVLRDGKNAGAGEPMSTMTRQRLISLMVGREERILERPAREHGNTEVVLEARSLSTSLGHKHISFALHRGEILGLYGLVGAGRSELARAIVGDAKVTGGELRLKDKPVVIRDMHEALNRYRIGYISEDRKQEGLILAHSIRQNIAVTIWHRLAGALGLIAPAEEVRAVRPYVERLEIRTPSIEQIVGNLSGGNQQKVSVAKWLAANVEILIIDEPTVGIDIKTKAYLHELIHEIAAAGTSVLLISSDMPEMVALADRILVMHGMRLVGEVPNDHRYESVSKAIMNAIHAVEEDQPAAAAG
ncbi:sugar ABC transporter ATP-binding protein [Mesorhizobium sp. BAC0120]|uniref:sugar ABC transporter ATP-binding protein n=1 Tax=Mesorhizobium sp. BAC0120 TaxID=3090670 RepID=UPI00298D277A|nr:sugar ABC transporter ATP-binding protein [Mesorhizobium sp. BAC0120]MDW6024875.1 sugar ABC transporter ATP-binding protein [Mesorhizobium sp. BAC0120]